MRLPSLSPRQAITLGVAVFASTGAVAQLYSLIPSLWHGTCIYKNMIQNQTIGGHTMTRRERRERVEELKVLLKVEANNLIYECNTEAEMIELQKLCNALDK